MAQFYELQLILLAGFCAVALLLEQYVSRQKRSAANADHLENGGPAQVSNHGGLSTLTRKYLVVYGIVMCNV